MSNIIYDFLTESFLFQDVMWESAFLKVSEDALRKELMRYREHVKKNLSVIHQEVTGASNKIKVVIESFGECPDEEILKQLALYVDYVIIADPILEFTEEKNQVTNSMLEFIGGGKEDTIDRERLAQNIGYLKRMQKLVACQYVKFVPISLIHEPPQEIPLCWSDNYFNDCLPPDIMEFLRGRAVVQNMFTENGTMYVDSKRPLQKGTAICISFQGAENRQLEFAQYMKQKVVQMDEKTNLVTFQLYIPDEIGEEEFKIWLHQSLNRACQRVCNETFDELQLAQSYHSMYLAKTDFTHELLSKRITEEDVNSKITNLSLQIDLPVISNVALDDLIEIRKNHGVSFANFRTELGKRLIALDEIKDAQVLRSRLDAIAYEVNEGFINEMNVESRKLLRSLGVDAAILAGSLLASYATGGLTMLGAAAAVLSGIKDTSKHIGNIQENPGYFLWKVKQKL